jgi:hypothetical protein
MKRTWKCLLPTAVFALFFSIEPFAWSQGKYTQIVPPGSVSTLATGIDAAADVVGYYQDANYIDHGFLLRGGSYTTLDYPGAQLTYLDGINNSGTQIVGGTESSAFIYDVQTQTFSAPINYPGATVTGGNAINDAGTIVGIFVNKNGQKEAEYGFELVGSTFTEISPPHADSTQPTSISSSGIVVGNSNSIPNFLFYGGEYLRATIPNLPGARPFGISPAGSILVGQSGLSGFLYAKANGKLLTLIYPEADNTTAWSVNASGEVAGFYQDANVYYGFTWTPPASGK